MTFPVFRTPMNIQTRITLLLFLIVTLFFSGLVIMKRYESRREDLLVKSNIYEKNTLFDKVLRLEGASLEMFVYDLSNLDETVRLAKTGQPEAPMLAKTQASFNVDAAWVYRPDHRLVFTTAGQDLAELPRIPSRHDFFSTLFSRSYFCHFFVQTPRGLMEVRSAPIQPARDQERRSQPAGVLFAGRLWSPDYIQNLSAATDSTIEVCPVQGGGDAALESTYDRQRGLVDFSRIAWGWDDNPIVRIRVQSRSEITRELKRFSRNQLVLVVAFAAGIVVLLAALLILWVNVPLKKISRSLNTGDPAALQPLRGSQTEFGNLARLILRFFSQKDQLTREIAERQRAEEALRSALHESRRSEAETAALLQAARAVLQYQDFAESGRAIVDACRSLSRAADGFIAEVAGAESAAVLQLHAGTQIPLSGICESACRSHTPVYTNTAAREPFAALLPKSHGRIDSLLCAPLIINGTTAALLLLINKPGGFCDNDVRMATAFGELSSVALLNSRTLESLERSEERYRSVVQTAEDAIVTTNAANEIVAWNRGAEAMFGYRADGITGRTAALLLPQRLRTGYPDPIPPAGEDGRRGRPTELVGLRCDGTEFPIELSRSMWKTGEEVFFTAIVRDITERRKAEDELRKSEQRFRDIVEHSLTGRFIVQDGRIVYMNQEQARLFGCLPEDFPVLECTNVHPEDTDRVRRFYADLRAGSAKARDVNFRVYALDARGRPADLRWVTCRGTIIEYDGRESVFVNMMDITRFMELEQLVRIQDKMASLGRVAAGIAHEIRNPLTGINSYLYSLKKLIAPDGPDRAATVIDRLQSASNKIEAVIRRVMDFSKPGTPHLSPCNINEPIQEALTLSAVTLRKSGIEIEKDLAPDLPLCYADFHMIEQVVLNLITNAVQALTARDGGPKEIVVSSRCQDAILITVTDTGPGIPEESRLKIFDPFYTTRPDGSGIGLSLCHRIVSDHGGSITAGTGTRGGAAFTVALPLHTSRPDQAATGRSFSR